MEAEDVISDAAKSQDGRRIGTPAFERWPE